MDIQSDVEVRMWVFLALRRRRVEWCLRRRQPELKPVCISCVNSRSAAVNAPHLFGFYKGDIQFSEEVQTQDLHRNLDLT